MSVQPELLDCNIRRHLETWLWPLRLLGSCPVHFPSLTFPVPRLAHTFLISCVLIFLTYLCITNYCFSSTSSGINVSRAVQCGTLLVFQMAFIVRRSALRELLEEFARAEAGLRRLGARVAYSRPPLAHATVSLLIMFTCEFLRYNNQNIHGAGSHSTLLISLFREALFLTSLIVVNYGMSTFMNSVVDLFQITRNYLSHTVASKDTKNTNRALIDLALVHDCICNLCEILNDFFSLQLLFFFGSTFVSLVLNTYFAFNGSIDTLNQVRSIFWGVVCFIKVDILAKLSIELKTLANDFNSELYQIMIDDSSGQTMNNEKLMLHICMKRDVDILVCGFFPLDNTLLHSMLTAATTYLVILVQFGPTSTAPPVAVPSTEVTAITTLVTKL